MSAAPSFLHVKASLPSNAPPHDVMFRSKFSASAESFLSSTSPSPSVTEDCECLECESIYPLARRPPLFRRSFPSLNKLQIPTTPLVWLIYLFLEKSCAYASRQQQTLLSPVTLQKTKAQMSTMGYSKLFNLGYFSATVSPFIVSLVLRWIDSPGPQGALRSPS